MELKITEKKMMFSFREIKTDRRAPQKVKSFEGLFFFSFQSQNVQASDPFRHQKAQRIKSPSAASSGSTFVKTMSFVFDL